MSFGLAQSRVNSIAVHKSLQYLCKRHSYLEGLPNKHFASIKLLIWPKRTWARGARPDLCSLRHVDLLKTDTWFKNLIGHIFWLPSVEKALVASDNSTEPIWALRIAQKSWMKDILSKFIEAGKLVLDPCARTFTASYHI